MNRRRRLRPTSMCRAFRRALPSFVNQAELPPVIADSDDRYSGDPLAEPLKIWLADKASTTIGEAADGMGLKDIDHSTRYRIGQLLALWGWRQRTAKVAGGCVAMMIRGTG